MADSQNIRNDPPAQSVVAPHNLPHDATLTYDPSRMRPDATAMLGDSAQTPGTLSLMGALRKDDAFPGDSPLAIPDGTRFTLIDVIGRGGFGEVWQAVQTSLGRTVAVKQLRHSADSGAYVSANLLRQEARTGALLEHPNVVPVYDLGTNAEGMPLIAMKLVQGEPWNRLLFDDFKALAADELLAKHLPILMAVCQAVAFAHSRGVLHRDLKPAQVMVGAFGEVLLMDWGLAIVWDKQRLPEGVAIPPDGISTLETASNPGGTPAYMAPEQTHPTAKGLGPWTDVYLLGGMLYEMLTGKMPHSAGNANAAFARAVLGDVTPPEKAAPGRDLPPELVAISLKAMESEPSNRFESAAEFLAALQDYQSGATRRRESKALVEAAAKRLGNAGERYSELAEATSEAARALVLWPGNHAAELLSESALVAYAEAALRRDDRALARAQVERITAGPLRVRLTGDVDRADRRAGLRERQRMIALVSVMVLLAGFGVLGIWANGQRKEAELRRAEAEAARKEAERNLLIASAQGEGASDLIDYVLGELKGAMDRELTVSRGITEPVANEVSHAIARDVASPVIKYFTGLDYKNWPKEMQLAHAQRMQNAGGRFIDFGRYEDAEALTTPSLAIRRDLLGENDPATAESEERLGTSLFYQGDFAESEDAHRRSLTGFYEATGQDSFASARQLAQLANPVKAVGRVQDAVELQEKGLAIFEKAGADRDDFAESLLSIASTYFDLGRFDDSERAARRGQEMFERLHGADSEKARLAIGMIASALAGEGRHVAEVIELRRREVALTEKYLGPDHPETGRALNSLAVALTQGPSKSREEVIEIYERAIALFEKALGPEHTDLALPIGNLAASYIQEKKYDLAEPLLERALAIRKKTLGPDHPYVAVSEAAMADLLVGTSRYPEAEAAYRRALEIRIKSQGEEHPATALVILQLSNLLREMPGRIDEAEQLVRRCIAIREKILGADSPDVGVALANLSSVLRFQKKMDEAESSLMRAIELFSKANGDEHTSTLVMKSRLVSLRLEGNHPDEAEALAREIVEVSVRINGEEAYPTAALVGMHGDCLVVQKNFAAAEAEFRRARDTHEKLGGVASDDTQTVAGKLGLALMEQGRLDEAEKFLKASFEHFETRAKTGGQKASLARAKEGLKKLAELREAEKGGG